MLKTIASEIIEFLLWIIHLIWNELILGWIFILIILPLWIIELTFVGLGVHYRLMLTSRLVARRAKLRQMPQ